MLKTKRYLPYLIGLIVLGLAALGLLLSQGFPLSSENSSASNILKAPPGSTPTATAFQPLASTATYLPTDYPTPTPTQTPKPELVRPASNTRGVDPIQQPDNQVNILILGSDQKYKGMVGRTDTIILVTINTETNTVNLTSFPRDLFVYIPGWTEQRINTAFGHGGFKLLQDTLMHNFGVKPDYYVVVNLWAFEYVVNDLGGIYVNVPQTVCDDKWGHGQSHCVYPGNKLMYGREALWFVRSRVTTNDFDRNRRQHLVLGSIFDRLFSLNSLTKIPQLYSTYANNVVTNIDLQTIINLAPTATKLGDSSNINHYYINQKYVTDWITPGGAQVLLPNYQAIRSLLKTALNAKR
ncbi:MAG: LCP family protein [Anaerolineales bacterium]